jgi:hypothetical protein
MINEIIQKLSARLPELSWKLNACYSVLPRKLLPPGLFRYQFEVTPQSCIDDIREDLERLGQQIHERSSSHLAEQVNKKINVLVQLCALKRDPKGAEPVSSFGVKTISTRRQWLRALEDDIFRLEAQQISLATALNQLKIESKLDATLRAQAELGEVERCLTLARETLKRAMG